MLAKVPRISQKIYLRRKRGVREGATDGPGLFTRGYAQPMKQFSADVGNTMIGRRLRVTYQNEEIDLSTAFFIDDVEHLSLIQDP